MSSLAPSATVLARLEFACGHAALVTLPRIKGATARQQNQRVSQEKDAARARPCDFCGPRGAEPATAPPAPGATLPHQDDTALVVAARLAPPDPSVGNGHQPQGTGTREESPMDNELPDPLPPTEKATLAKTDTRPVGVFPPPRKLSDEQERELTHLYAETSTPIADIAQRFSLWVVSVGRIAQRNGAPSRRRRAARATAPEAPPAPAPEPASHAAGGGVRRRFRIRYVAEAVVEADDLRDALGQAEALGATGITGIVEEDS